MHKMLKPLAIAATLIATFTSANAADISFVRGCASGTDQICHSIFINGPILNGDADKFETLIKKNNITRAVVVLNSPGGLAVDGLGIGYQVMDHKFTTYVRANEWCASMCGYIWLAGSTRYAQPHAHIGFHAIYTGAVDNSGKMKKNAKPTLSNTSNALNALLGAYMARIGLSDKAIVTFTLKSANQMYWLESWNEIEELGIKLTII
jgi:hypothetical protein